MENLLLILVCLAAGVALRRVAAFTGDASKALNAYVIYVALPALTLVKIQSLQLSGDVLIPLLMPWLMLALGAGLVLAAGRFWGWSREVVGALLMVVPLGNTSFMGFPLVTAWFGEVGLPYAIIYDHLGSFFALTIYGALVLANYGGSSRPTLVGIARRIITFPPFIALLLAFALRPVGLPELLQPVLSRIGDTLVPVVLFAVGLQWRLSLAREQLAPFSVALLIKLVLLPLIALAGIKALGIDSLAAKVAVFESGMAPMITAGAMAIAAGLAPRLTAAIVGYGILLSLGTLAVLYPLL